jgi:hypothetical protein
MISFAIPAQHNDGQLTKRLGLRAASKSFTLMQPHTLSLGQYLPLLAHRDTVDKPCGSCPTLEEDRACSTTYC